MIDGRHHSAKSVMVESLLFVIVIVKEPIGIHHQTFSRIEDKIIILIIGGSIHANWQGLVLNSKALNQSRFLDCHGRR